DFRFAQYNQNGTCNIHPSNEGVDRAPGTGSILNKETGVLNFVVGADSLSSDCEEVDMYVSELGIGPPGAIVYNPTPAGNYTLQINILESGDSGSVDVIVEPGDPWVWFTGQPPETIDKEEVFSVTVSYQDEWGNLVTEHEEIELTLYLVECVEWWEEECDEADILEGGIIGGDAQLMVEGVLT